VTVNHPLSGYITYLRILKLILLLLGIMTLGSVNAALTTAHSDNINMSYSSCHAVFFLVVADQVVQDK